MAEYQKITMQQREQGMRLACQLFLRGDAEVLLQNPAAVSCWRSLDLSTWPADCPAAVKHLEFPYALAIDLGTTQLRLSLWDRQRGVRIASRHGANPQLALGEDVLTRLEVDRKRDQALTSLSQMIREALIEGVRDILARDLGEIKAVLEKLGRLNIVANTAMLLLLTDSDSDRLFQPENWEKQLCCQINEIEDWREKWDMPNAEIVIQQPLAGFIGSDILADLIAVDITRYQQPVMLADFGTNTEIALWDGKKIWLTSVPGGPAFEGVGMENGVAAIDGAITAVRLEKGEFNLQILGQQQAKGFCASGFVDAVALLRQLGILKVSGRFANSEDNKGYYLLADNQATLVKPADIDALQRAKAATAAAMQYLLVLAGIPNHNLSKLWVCGAFGQHLNVQHAISLGLLPAMDCSEIELFADAALSGSEKMLLNPESEEQANHLRQSLTIVNVAKYPEYDECFINQLRLKPFMENSDV